MDGVMRAAFYHGARHLTIGEVPIPRPKPGEALLRVKRVGICGTDLHIFQGHLDRRVPKGGIIGHEALGEVAEVEASSGFSVGDRVVVEPLLFCGRCRACAMGATYLCYSLKVLGVEEPGGMQEYWCVPTARLLRVPDNLPDDHAPLIEPLAIATHDVRRAGVKSGDKVLVFGGGPIGTLIAFVSRYVEAEVTVAEPNPFRLEMLQRAGFRVVPPGEDVVEWANGWTGGTGVDVAFEVSGSTDAARAITEVVRVWGTISIVAIHSAPVPVDLYRTMAREITVHGSRLYFRRDWEEAIHLAATCAVPIGALVSRRIPLTELQRGMEEALAGGPVMKVIVDLAPQDGELPHTVSP